MPDHSPYESRVLFLLGSYQLLEFSLKIYIAGAYSLIKQSLKGAIPFEYKYKDIENFPLGKLLQTFSHLNQNKALHNKLNQLKSKRNHIAHRAMLEQHDVIRDVLDLGEDEPSIDLSEAEREINECLILMAVELEYILNQNTNTA
jgi:hypothetical protein